MCGIAGYIGAKKAAPIIHQALRSLEYRGYDSCGIATVDRKIHFKKDAGMIDEIHRRIDLDALPGSVGIGHTRWATHGSVTQENAHPHLDCNGEIAVVHNGIISNYTELREELTRKGHKFRSNTDTECMAHLLEESYNGDIEKALRSALKKIKGTYAFAILSRAEPDKIICARNESPLVLGLGKGEMFLGSDIAAFLRFTKKAVPLDDGEYAVVTNRGYVVKSISSCEALKKKVLEIKWSAEQAEKEGYPHFMLKEIFEQPRSIAASLNVYPQDIRKLAQMVAKAKNVYIVAAGTSLHAGMVAEYWFSQLCGKQVVALDSSELQNKGILDKDSLVIAITQSGETYDTLAAMRHAKSKGAKTAAVVNVMGSTATRLADLAILQGSGIEVSVCATKTYTSQLTILLRTAIELVRLQKKNTAKLEKALLEVPKLTKKTLELNEEIKGVADNYFNASNYMYIGRGINIPSALEGALKLKEITYLHAEGMSAGLLKHGTISLIDENMNTVAIFPAEGENRVKMESNIQEVKARGGIIIGITSGSAMRSCNVNLVAPKCEEFVSPIIFAPIFQLLAYHVAVKKGRNVDKPRALAKSVTVE